MTIKQQLDIAFENGDMETIGACLEEYLNNYPEDYDRFSYLVGYSLMQEDSQSALQYASEAVTLNPNGTEANYNMGLVFELCGELGLAHFYYMRAFYIEDIRKTGKINVEELTERIKSIEAMAGGDNELAYAVNSDRNYIINAANNPYKYDTKLPGSVYFDTKGNAYYNGRYKNWFDEYWSKNPRNDSKSVKIELFKTPQKGRKIALNTEGDFFVPFVPVPDEPYEDNRVLFVNSNTEKVYFNRRSYAYLHLDKPEQIIAEHDIVIGEPIKLNKDNSKKKLVLNIFIDSINWKVFEEVGNGNYEEGMKKIMPNTYRFFKEGLICSHAYANSEWTTPSFSSYWTGCHSDKHMNLNTDIWWPFTYDYKLLAEYFKNEGYFTSCINTNDAFLPSQGYMRGFDRMIYQNGTYRKADIIGDTLEQINAFKDYNQFVVMQLEDLHHVAGGFNCGIGVQMQTPIEDYRLDGIPGTTVKQGRSVNKEKIYLREFTEVDMYLETLYQYILNNYSPEEYVVSFFSDHGTAFIVDDGQPVMCEQRTHIPMMFRGSGVKGILDEFVQNIDYGRIMCKLCNIDYDQKQTEAVLPVMLGGDGREYVLAQTIFPGDPYQAMIKDEKYEFYLKSLEPIDNEFRFNLDKYEIWMIDENGNEINDEQIMTRYSKIVIDRINKLIKYL